MFATSDIQNPTTFVYLCIPWLLQNIQFGIYCYHSSSKRLIGPKTQTLEMENFLDLFKYISINSAWKVMVSLGLIGSFQNLNDQQ